MTQTATKTVYTVPPRNGNGLGNGHGNCKPPILITGRNLTHWQHTIGQRAALAAQLFHREAQLVDLTVAGAARLVQVSCPTVKLAVDLKPITRARVAVGELPLFDAVKGNGLVTAWLAATADEKAALGSVVGVDAIWDSAMQPLI